MVLLFLFVKVTCFSFSCGLFKFILDPVHCLNDKPNNSATSIFASLFTLLSPLSANHTSSLLLPALLSIVLLLFYRVSLLTFSSTYSNHLTYAPWLSALLWAMSKPCNHTFPLGSIGSTMTSSTITVYGDFCLTSSVQPVHHRGEQGRAQRWSLLYSHLHLEKKHHPLHLNESWWKISYCEGLTKMKKKLE